MKKLILIILLSCFIGNVSAEEYTNYSDFGPFTENKIEADTLTDVKIERRYKYYKYIKQLGPYGQDSNNQYKYLDKNDYIYTNFTDYKEEKPEEKENRVVEEKIFYQYLKVGPIDEVEIIADSEAVIENLKLYENNTLLNYEIINDKFGSLEKNNKIILRLNKEVELDNLKYQITSGGNSEDLYKYTLNFKGKGVIYQSIESSTIGNYTISFKNSIFAYINYYDYFSEEKLETSKSLKFVKEVLKYRYKDKLYRLYNLEKEYYQEYLNRPYQDYIYKDENLYKDFYSKRVRSLITNEKVKVPNTDSPKTNSKLSHKNEKNALDYFNLIYTITVLVIIILVLSKHYQNKKRCVKVKKVMLC